MNLVNLENVGKAYGTQVLLDRVSLGLSERERVGVVGRNGGGKTTLVSLIAGLEPSDEGRVTHARGLRVGFLTQHEERAGPGTVRDRVLGEVPEHEWAGDRRTREVLDGLLAEVELDASFGALSGGEQRRVMLAALLVAEHDLLVLDEPTNHLDIEAVDWLARYLAGPWASSGRALVVVTHDRWFLDTVCTQTWEVAGGAVHQYDGGYAAYVLARAERARLAAAAEERRRNLLRKELAWLRRGPPARTSKPKFRLEAASALIADEPPPRDAVELVRFATARLGKTVYELHDVALRAGGSVLLDGLNWRLGPGERVGVVGPNGSGKTSLLRLLADDLEPDAGRVRRGKTVRPAYLSQQLAELNPRQRVLEAAEEVRRVVRIGRGREMSAGQLLERFGFRGERAWTPVGELSGGERRRLQLMRLLMSEPNVLLLDEPTNDLDIDTLTELEDLLDGWPGSLVVVAHDRYFLERVTDHVVALLGDGKLSYLGGGIDEYLARRRSERAERARIRGGHAAAQDGRGTGASPPPAPAPPARTGGGTAAERRAARKELARLERRLERLTARESELHESLAAHASDYQKLIEMDAELREVRAERERIEDAWLAVADVAD